MDRKREMMFDNYPIIVMSNDIEYSHYEVQKKESGSSSPKKDEKAKSLGVLDKAKEKALELKDSIVDTTKQLSNDQAKE